MSKIDLLTRTDVIIAMTELDLGISKLFSKRQTAEGAHDDVMKAMDENYKTDHEIFQRIEL